MMIKYKLPSNKILSKHFFQLIDIQHNCELLLTPRLKINDLIYNNFNKMKVNKAENVFSNDVSSSFKLLADEFNKTVYYYCMVCKNDFKWFCLITSRSCNLAFGKKKWRRI